jgi:hypothetical protein
MIQKELLYTAYIYQQNRNSYFINLCNFRQNDKHIMKSKLFKSKLLVLNWLDKLPIDNEKLMIVDLTL